MTSKKKMVEPFLNGEILFKKYFSMGAAASISVLTRFAISNNMLNQNSGKPTRMGVWKAMWRWASFFENKDKAFEIFSQYVFEYGWTYDTDFPWGIGTKIDKNDWNKFMNKKIRVAWQYPTDTMYQKFFLRNGWI